MKKIIFLIVLLIPIWLNSNAKSPKAELKQNLALAKMELEERQYTVEPRKFFIPLKKGYKVNYVITTPSYLAKTAFAIVNNGLATRVKVLIYKSKEKFGKQKTLIYGGFLQSDYSIQEIEDKSYFYLVEIQMLEVESGSEEAMVELIHGFKYPSFSPEPKYHTDDGSKTAPGDTAPCYGKLDCPGEKKYNRGFEKKI